MSLQSDLVLNVSKFKPEAVSDSEKKLNDALIAMTEKGPQWFEVCKRAYLDELSDSMLTTEQGWRSQVPPNAREWPNSNAQSCPA